MNKEKINNEEMFECKMYITDLETNKDSKEINIQDLVFDDYVEFEFGDYEDEDYLQLPYKDFKFFINDYSVTFYSPQYNRLNNILDELENYILNHYIVGHTIQNASLDDILKKIKELKNVDK